MTGSNAHRNFLFLQAFIPTPASKTVLVGKAAVIVMSTLALAVHVLWARPFAPAHAWKGPVRAALLVLAATAAAVVAWAGALDLRILSGLGAARTLTAGAYVLVVLFCVAVAALVTGVGAAMLRGVREESARISAQRAVETQEAFPSRRRLVSLQDALVERAAPPSVDAAEAQLVSPSAGAGDSAVPPDPAGDAAFKVRPLSVRRQPRGLGRSGNWRRRQPSALRDPGLAAAAAALLQPNAVTSDTAVRAACAGIVETLGRLPPEEARRASAELLPGFSARLEAALRGGKEREADAETVSSVCRAVAALSDHADAATLARLGRSGLSQELAAFLERFLHSPAQGGEGAADTLWLLGNLSADAGAASSLIAAGGAEVLVALLSHPAASSSSSPSSAAASALHVCVALASVSAHDVAATALLRAGVLSPLAHILSRAQGGGGSFADAEAACRVLANVLRPCGAAGGQDAAQACSELAASDAAIEGCTAVLRNAISFPIEAYAAALHAAEALLYVVGCAEGSASVAASAARAGSASVTALAGQASAAGTAAAVAVLLRGMPEGSSGRELTDGPLMSAEGETDPLRRVLDALASRLRPWMARQGSTESGGGL